jgi:hypothetical protein
MLNHVRLRQNHPKAALKFHSLPATFTRIALGESRCSRKHSHAAEEERHIDVESGEG